MPLTANDLDSIVKQGCSNPRCTQKHHDTSMYLRPSCHPDAGVQAFYDSNNKTLNLQCLTCNKAVASIKVEHCHTEFSFPV